MQFLNLHLLEADPQVNRYDSIYYLPVLGCSRFCFADKTGFLTTNVSMSIFQEKLKTVLLLSFFLTGKGVGGRGGGGGKQAAPPPPPPPPNQAALLEY